MVEKVFCVIIEIEKEKKERGIVPSYAMDVEVKARFPGESVAVREALRSLYRERRIEAGRTLNHIWIRAKTNTKTNTKKK